MPTSNQVLQLQFIPMQVSEIVPAVEETAGMSLVLHPGESSQLVVQLQNVGTRSLDITLTLQGEFSPSWYQIGLEGQTLPPGRRMDAVIHFHIPADFFEDQHALQVDQQLAINFKAQVLVSYQEEAGHQAVEYSALTLCVRPRCRYQQYLPAIYREVDFIGRFLKIFEQGFDPVVQSLRVMWAYLDPLTSPEALQPFLANWVGWNLDPRWSLAQQRRLIRNAMEIYRWRGTRRGLRLFLHLYTNLPLDDHLPSETDKHICIEEASYKAFSLNSSCLGQDTALGRGRPYHFTVRIRPEPESQIDEQLLHHIINQEKPAFSTYELFIEAASTVQHAT